jgi:hypothetical protein
MAKSVKKILSAKQQHELLQILKTRFEKHSYRHKGIVWPVVESMIISNSSKLFSLYEMERTGGEPDVLKKDDNNCDIVFFDCAVESPKGRRSLCYDEQARSSRKENKPSNSAIGMATAMGIEILTEEQYKQLQQIEKVDTKTSSWLLTPNPIRELGGSIFGDCRYGKVFVYHNGAESYYAGRGFRGFIRISI